MKNRIEELAKIIQSIAGDDLQIVARENADVMELLANAVKSALNAEKAELADLEKEGWQPDSMPIAACKSLIKQYEDALKAYEERAR